MNPLRSRSKGRLAFLGLIIGLAERAVKQNEARHAERVNHAVRAAGKDDIGIAAANLLVGFADRLGTGRAGRQGKCSSGLGHLPGRPHELSEYRDPAPIRPIRSRIRRGRVRNELHPF
jgi:hypothetical protein